MDYENLYTQVHRVWLFSPARVQQERSCAVSLRTGTPGLTSLNAEPGFFPTSLWNQDIWDFNSLGERAASQGEGKSIMKMKGLRAVGALKDTSLLCNFNSSSATSMRCCQGYWCRGRGQVLGLQGRRVLGQPQVIMMITITILVFVQREGWCEGNHIKSKRTQIKWC